MHSTGFGGSLGGTHNPKGLSMKHALVPAFALLVLSVPVQADPVITALETAIEAYREGDMLYAQDEINEALRLMGEMKTQGLAAFLPDPPEGWTREIDTEAQAGLAMMGGGVMAVGNYVGPAESMKLTLMADNAMVAQLGAMLGNSAMLSQMGKVRRINRVRFLEQETSLQALVGTRVLVQAEGASPDVMEPILSSMDFAALERFGN